MAKYDDQHRINKIIVLAQEKIYDTSERSINIARGIDIAREVYGIIKLEDLEYTRKSDGWSLLHFAITSYNPFLVALFIDYGFDVDVKAKNATITPRELYEKIGYLAEIVEAFENPRNFLEQYEVLYTEYLEKERSSSEISIDSNVSSSSLIGVVVYNEGDEEFTDEY